ncbi:MAG TPA: hypothetical protein VM537_19505 [Anaerolineae bacterium]|nr:hypothetical protein [Anaerolineae bacterium]
MARPRGYVDSLRAAIYGLALACLVIGREELGEASIALILVVIFFLVLDGWSRAYNRDLILEQLVVGAFRQSPVGLRWYIRVEPVLFFFEVAGLFFFVGWASRFISMEDAAGSHFFCLAVFVVLAVAHNCIHLALWPSQRVSNYLAGVVLRDAVEMAEVELWFGGFRRWLEGSSEAISARLDGSGPAFWRNVRHVGLCLRAAGIWTAAHIALQFSAIHVLWTNAFLAAFLCLPWVGDQLSKKASLCHTLAPLQGPGPGLAGTWPVSVKLVLSLFTVTIVSYFVSSLMELDRRGVFDGKYLRERKPAGVPERMAQVVGNTALLTAILLLISGVSIHQLPLVTLAFQGIAMMLILVNERTRTEHDILDLADLKRERDATG